MFIFKKKKKKKKKNFKLINHNYKIQKKIFYK